MSDTPEPLDPSPPPAPRAAAAHDAPGPGLPAMPGATGADAGGSARLERRALALLGLFVVLVIGSILFVLYARGAFEPTQRLVLLAEDSEGVVVGMDLTFAGFPIGRVRRTELAADGSVRILIDVPRRDAHWLRTSSVFTMTRSLVGGVAIRAYSGIPNDPPLPDAAERRVLAGDATTELPKMVADARALLANLTALTAADSALAGTLANVQRLTGRIDTQLGGKRGALDLLLGDEAPKLVATLERANRLLATLDGTVRRADERLLGDQGLVAQGQGLVADGQVAVRQINGLLTQARESLTRVDTVLKEAEAIAANARVATTDLGALRAEVDASLRKVEQLVNEVNRLWPLRRDTEIKLP